MYLEKSIKDQLTALGLDGEPMVVTKNGIECRGIRVFRPGCEKEASPIIYYSEDETLEQFSRRVQDAIQSCGGFDGREVLDWNYVKGHVFLALQRRGHEQIVKKNYLNLEIFMRIYVTSPMSGETGSVKVTAEILNRLKKSKREIWTAAEKNTREGFKIVSMASMLEIPETDDGVSLYVLLNDNITDGAVGLYYPELLREFCVEHGETGCVILPSSTAEMICILKSEANILDPLAMAAMVNDINLSEVDEIMRLDPVVYQYDVANDEISIAAAYAPAEAM